MGRRQKSQALPDGATPSGSFSRATDTAAMDEDHAGDGAGWKGEGKYKPGDHTGGEDPGEGLAGEGSGSGKVAGGTNGDSPDALKAGTEDTSGLRGARATSGIGTGIGSSTRQVSVPSFTSPPIPKPTENTGLDDSEREEEGYEPRRTENAESADVDEPGSRIHRGAPGSNEDEDTSKKESVSASHGGGKGKGKAKTDVAKAEKADARSAEGGSDGSGVAKSSSFETVRVSSAGFPKSPPQPSRAAPFPSSTNSPHAQPSSANDSMLDGPVNSKKNEEARTKGITSSASVLSMIVNDEAEEEEDEESRPGTPTSSGRGVSGGIPAKKGIPRRPVAGPPSGLFSTSEKMSAFGGGVEGYAEESGSGSGARYTAAEKGKAPVRGDTSASATGTSATGTATPTAETPATPTKRKSSPSAMVSPQKKVAPSTSKAIARGDSSMAPEDGAAGVLFNTPVATPSRVSKRRREGSAGGSEAPLGAEESPSNMTPKRQKTNSEAKTDSETPTNGGDLQSSQGEVGMLLTTPNPLVPLVVEDPTAEESGINSVAGASVQAGPVNPSATAPTVEIPEDFLRTFVSQLPEGTVLNLPMLNGPPLRWVASNESEKRLEAWTPPQQVVAVEAGSDFGYTGKDPEQFGPGMATVLRWLTDERQIIWVLPPAVEYATECARRRTSEQLAWSKTCDALRVACRPFRRVAIAESLAGKVISLVSRKSGYHMWTGLAKGMVEGNTLEGIRHIDVQTSALGDAPRVLAVLGASTSLASLTICGNGVTRGYSRSEGNTVTTIFNTHRLTVLEHVEQVFLHCNQIIHAKHRISRIMPNLKRLICKIDGENINPSRLAVDALDLVHMIHRQTQWGPDIFKESYGNTETGFDDKQYEHKCKRLVIQCIDARNHDVIEGEMQFMNLATWLQRVPSSFHLKGKWPKLETFHLYSRLAVNFKAEGYRSLDASPLPQVIDQDKLAWCPDEDTFKQKATILGNAYPKLKTVMFTFGLTVRKYDSTCQGIYLPEEENKAYKKNVDDRVVHHMVARLTHGPDEKVSGVDVEIFTSTAWERVELCSGMVRTISATAIAPIDHLDVRVHGLHPQYIGSDYEDVYGAADRRY